MLGFNYGECAAVYRGVPGLSTTAPGIGANSKLAMTNIGSGIQNRSIVLVGVMGAGKSCIGQRLADRLGLPFVDADEEIVRAAGCSIEDIFELYGEAAFRDGERRVIARLLNEGPVVLATGGGAFLDEETRGRVREYGISVWLRADLDILVERTGRRGGRPLLKNGDPRATLERLMTERHPVYAEADIIVDTSTAPADRTVDLVVLALESHDPERHRVADGLT